MKITTTHTACLVFIMLISFTSQSQNRNVLNYLDQASGKMIPKKDNQFSSAQPKNNTAVDPNKQQSALSGYLFEGFEANFPPTGWQIVDVSDTTTGWNSSFTADFPASFQGLQSAYCRYEYSTPSSGESWLISPQFSVSGSDSLSFQFKLEYYGFAPDSTFILVSNTDSNLTSFNTVIDFFAEGFNYPTDSSSWHYKSYSLSAFSGQNIYVAIKNKNDEGDGIFVDNFELGTRPAKEVAVETIDVEEFIPTITANPQATIRNNGGGTQSFDIHMMITGGYVSTKTITLPPLSSSQIYFDPWTPSTGDYIVQVQTLLIGDVDPSNDTLSKSIKVLEPFLNYGWSAHDPLPESAFGSAVASVNTASGSRIFLLSGYTQLSIMPDAYEYDLNFNTWANISPLPVESTLGASATANNKIFVFGGRTLQTPQGATQIYDPVTDSWTTGTPMPTPIVTPAFGTYKDSLVYIFGGLNDATGTGTNMVQIYDTYNDTWSMGTPKPGSADYGLRGGIVNNKIVIAGGASNNQLTAATYVGTIDTINPTQISWTQVADFPAGTCTRMGSGISVDKNSPLIIFAGGSRDNTYLPYNKVFAFDVVSNTWKLGPNKPTARSLFYMAPIIQNDSIYLVAPGGSPVAFDDSDSHEWLNLGYYSFPTSLPENNGIRQASLHPNPARESTVLSFNLEKASNIQIKITDLPGNELFVFKNEKMNAGMQSLVIPLSNLSKGMYFCTMISEGHTVSKKIVVN